MSSASLAAVSFPQIRRGSRVVAERAAHVGILTAKADELAASFAPLPRSPLPHGLELDHVLPFLVLRAALRFGSGYEPKLRLRPGESAAENLDAALVDQFARSGPIAPRDMVHATPATVARLRGQGLDEPPQAEFIELQTRALRDLGRYLIDRHEGSYVHLVESAQGSAARMCETLSTIPFFHDVQRYRGIDVHFFHRAQRLVHELSNEAFGDGFVRFDDLGELAPSSDAECALALRGAGILSYDSQLAERVDHGEIVPAHTEREVEIRAATIHAVERITSTIQVRSPDVTALDVDRWLRARAREARSAGQQPHRTRTVSY
ncbi:MAG: hypothetical protein NTY35_03995 [Planctomycetota bacterium]|nr:hypothetical protein [Planctomycetota bacterium]